MNTLPAGISDGDSGDSLGLDLSGITDVSIERLIAVAKTSIERDEGDADADFLEEISRIHVPSPHDHSDNTELSPSALRLITAAKTNIKGVL